VSAAITIKSIQKMQSRVLVIFQVALSGNYTAGGDTLDFTAAALPSGDVLPTQQPPELLTLGGQAGYLYGAVPGTGLGDSKVKVFEDAGAAGELAELGAAAYPAAAGGDTILGLATFPALQ
jgi:hypothetical protein